VSPLTLSGTVDVWAQIVTQRMPASPWLETLRRWTGRQDRFETSVSATLKAMDDGGVDVALLSAWSGPEGELISNEEVAANADLPPFFARYVTTPHSVVTAHLIDEAGQPTIAARDEILEFFRRRLASPE
jgi:hypothetical protein